MMRVEVKVNAVVEATRNWNGRETVPRHLFQQMKNFSPVIAVVSLVDWVQRHCATSLSLYEEKEEKGARH
jgi:hypothetical protein